MANEIGVIHTTGATVTAKVLYLDNSTGWTQQGSDVSLTEDGTITGHYAGDMPTASAGRYYISFYDSGTLIDGKTTAIDWDGTAVITGNSIDTIIDTAISNADIPGATWATNFNELTSIPGGSTTVENMIKLVYLLTRNRITQTSTTTTVYADDGTTAVGTATITDDGTTTTRGELG